MLPNGTNILGGGQYFLSTTSGVLETFGLAAAALALGINEEEFSEFASSLKSLQQIPNVPPEYVYARMIETAYEIKKARGTIADG